MKFGQKCWAFIMKARPDKGIKGAQKVYKYTTI